LAPTEEEYLPAAHGVHWVAPTEEEYLPAAHGVHWVAEVLYVPASHAVHTVVPVYPSIHVQPVIAVLPAADVKFVGHDKQETVLDTTCNMLVRACQLLELEQCSCPLIFVAGYVPSQTTCTFDNAELTEELIINRDWVGFFHKNIPRVLCLNTGNPANVSSKYGE